MMDLPAIDPAEKPADELVLPETFDLRFEGFAPEAFDVLERLRAQPHIDQYQKEKTDVRRFLKEPFKRYRDDLVVNWVLPNRLDFETEKHVFSRLLKNDFGAGGCHHHLWMSFYRPGRRRLTDIQVVHSIDPDGFTVGLFVGGYAKDLLRQARAVLQAEPERFRTLMAPLWQEGRWASFYETGRSDEEYPLRGEAGEDVQKAKNIWIRRVFPRDEVLERKTGLVRQALEAVIEVWPLYTFFAQGKR